MIAAAAAAVAIAGAELPTRYASGASAIEARTDPSETYFVIQTVRKKIVSAAGIAGGTSTANTPHAVATPFPPRNRSQTG